MAEQFTNDRQSQQTQQNTQDTGAQPTGQVGRVSNSDAGNAKAIGVIGYIIPLLFFLPYVTDMKDNEFAMFHANQQLNLLLYWVVTNVLSWILMFILIGLLVGPILWILGVVLAIMGIINVLNEEKKPLPVIGSIELLK